MHHGPPGDDGKREPGTIRLDFAVGIIVDLCRTRGIERGSPSLLIRVRLKKAICGETFSKRDDQDGRDRRSTAASV